MMRLGLGLGLTRGGPLMPELWVGFDLIQTDWTDNLDGSATKVAGVTAFSVGQLASLVIGKTYTATFIVTGRTGGNLRIDSTGTPVTRTTNDTFQETFLASSVDILFRGSSAFNGTVRPVSVKEV